MNVTPIKRQRRETRAQYVVRVWTGLRQDGVPEFVTREEATEIAQAYGISARVGGSLNRAGLANLIAANTPKPSSAA